MPATPGARRLSPRNRDIPPFLQGVPRYPFPVFSGARGPRALATTPASGAITSVPPRVQPPQRPQGPPAAAGPPAASHPRISVPLPPLGGGSALARSNGACPRGFTDAQVGRWLAAWNALRPHVARLMAAFPSVAAFCGFPLFAMWGMESAFRLGAANRRELNARRSSTGSISGSWGIGQVIDANFPSLYGELRRNAAPFPPFAQPPTLSADHIRGLDLTQAGTGLSGLAYALMWLVRASRAYDQMLASGPSTRNRDITALASDWRAATAGLPDHIVRGLWLRIWGGSSSWRGARTQLRAAKTVQRLACLRAVEARLAAIGQPIMRLRP